MLDLRPIPFLALALALASGPLSAANLSVELNADAGDVSEALVSLHALNGESLSDPDSIETMDQKNRQFSPIAIAVRKGGQVRFLNNDDVRHHVYSFSAPKRFELPLYKGEPPEDIRFDTPGTVVLGCNIHDWMVGWVHVMDTPYFAFADDQGQVQFNAPPGEYRLRVWHPDMDNEDLSMDQTVQLTDSNRQASISLPLAPEQDEDGLDRRRRDRF